MSTTTTPPLFADPARPEDERRAAVAPLFREALASYGIRDDLLDAYTADHINALTLNARGELSAGTGFGYTHELTSADAVRELARRAARGAPLSDKAPVAPAPSRAAPSPEQAIRARLRGRF